MPLPRLARAGLVCVALVLLAAAPASATTRKQATSKALTALGSKTQSGSVVVFGLPKPLSPGTRVAQSSTRKFQPLVATVGRERAFFFYEDSGSFGLYPHPGRVVLVGAKSGTVRVSKALSWAPLVDGKLPTFLRSSKHYRSPKYRVFYKQATGTAAPPQEPTVFAAGPLALDAEELATEGPNSHPKANDVPVRAKQNRPKNITLTASDADGDLLTFEISDQPKHGTLSGQPPDVTYTPDAGYLGKDKFAYKANDGEALSNTGHVSIDVVPLGAAPVVATSVGCTDYTEGAAAVAVDPALAASDPDDTVLASATVRIAANFQDGDVLMFSDQSGITSSYEDDTGVLTLTGDASVAAYEAALRSVRYRNQASGNPSATKDIEFTVNDAGNDSAPATKQVCITGGAGGTNNPPSGDPGEGALSYIENDGPLPLDASFVVGDADSPNLSGATVQFITFVSAPPEDDDGNPIGPGQTIASYAPDQDELAFTDQNGITGSWDVETGKLTLSGTASVADYEAALRSATYENTSEDPSDLTRRVRFQVTDASGANSIPRTRDVFVTPVNDAPFVTTSEGSGSAPGDDPAVPLDAGLSAGDVDDDDLEGAVVRISGGFTGGDDLVFIDQLGISGSYNTGTGVLTLSGTAPVADYEAALRSIEYRHAGNPAGSRTVEFTVNDGELDSAPATRDIHVNDRPVLDSTDAALAYTENDGAVAADPGITATDADSPDLQSATVEISANFTEAEDELAFTDQNGITGSYDDSTGTLTLTGSASVANYEAALRSVTYTNSSEDPSTATRTVTFRVDDGAAAENASDAVTRDIEVTSVNDVPAVTTSAGPLAYTEGDPATALDSAVTVTDADDANLEGAQVSIASGFEAGDELIFVDQLGISGVYNTGTGLLTLSGTASVADYEAALRSIEYLHTGDNPSAARTVEYTVTDGGDDSATASRDVAVTPVNDAPAVSTSAGDTEYVAGEAATPVDSALSVSDADDANLEGATVRLGSSFESGDVLAFEDQSGISGIYNAEDGTLTLTGSASVADYETALRSVAYASGSSPSSTTRIVEFMVNDGDADSNTASKSVAITVGNEAPVVTTSDGATAYNPGDPATAVDSALTVSDADDSNLEGAEVRIGSGFEAGDELIFVDQLGISGVYNTGPGVLTLTGTASVADYEAALRSIKFQSSAENPSGSRSVEFEVNDGEADSNTAAKSVDITEPPPPEL